MGRGDYALHGKQSGKIYLAYALALPVKEEFRD